MLGAGPSSPSALSVPWTCKKGPTSRRPKSAFRWCNRVSPFSPGLLPLSLISKKSFNFYRHPFPQHLTMILNPEYEVTHVQTNFSRSPVGNILPRGKMASWVFEDRFPDGVVWRRRKRTHSPLGLSVPHNLVLLCSLVFKLIHVLALVKWE